MHTHTLFSPQVYAQKATCNCNKHSFLHCIKHQGEKIDKSLPISPQQFVAFSMGVMAMTFPNLRNPRGPTGRGLTRLIQEVIEVPDMPTEEAPATEK